MEQIEQIGKRRLDGEPSEPPGLNVHLHALIDRAREGGNAGDVVLTGALINFYFARLDNIALAKRVKDFDPIDTLIPDREQACDDAIREVFSRRVAPRKLAVCEEASLDPAKGKWPLELADLNYRDDAVPQGDGIRSVCADTLRYVMENISHVTLSGTGVLGENVAEQRKSAAGAFCRGTGEARAADAVYSYHALRLRTIRAQLDALQAYKHRKIKVRSEGDYEEWVKQSWVESVRGTSYSEALSAQEACFQSIESALQRGKLSEPINTCKVL